MQQQDFEITNYRRCFPLPVQRNVLFQRFSKVDNTKVRTRYLSFPLLPKMKEVHFKTINDIYPCSEFLRVRITNVDYNVKFCQKDIESQEQLVSYKECNTCF